MAAEAKRGLAWRAEFNRGGTAVGVARARDISNRVNLSPETIGRMVSYFARHEVDKQGEGFSPGEPGYPSAGRIAWALWGGDPGASWARARQRELNTENQFMKIEIENRAGKLKLNDGVHKESADKLIDELEKLYGKSAVDAQMKIGDIVCSADNALESIDVEINSPGGSVFEGNRIYNALREMSARGVEVVTTVNGLAASMGSVILMAGDKRRMTKGSRVMIHEASTIASGDARALRKTSDLLENISSEIAGIYAERTGGDAKKIRQLMLAETWMTAEEAKDNGFIHAIIKDGKSEEFDKGAKSMAKGIFSIFKSDDAAADILAAAKSENESLTAELESAQAKLAEAQGFAQVVAEKDVEIQNLTNELNTLKGEVSTIKAELETAKSEVEAKVKEIETVKASVETKAIELLAARGHKSPVDLNGDDGLQNSKEMTREEFNKLTPHARTQFSKSGGKIV